MHTNSVLPRTLILMDEDPRLVMGNWLRIDERVAGVSIVAYIVPFGAIQKHADPFHNGVPIITWEDPHDDAARARQYIDLYRIVRADRVIDLGWSYPILLGAGDAAYVISVPPLLYTIMSGIRLSRLIRKKFERQRGE